LNIVTGPLPERFPRSLATGRRMTDDGRTRR
jgi:hypothetical protein